MHHWSWALESIIGKHNVESLKAQLALSHNVCYSLANESETTTLTGDQKAAIAHRLDAVIKESHILRLAIDLLERQEKEERGFAESPIPKV